MLNKDQILGAHDSVREQINVPEWNGDVWVATITGKDRDAWEQSMIVTKGKKREVKMQNIRAALLVRCIQDDDGKRLFTDDDAEALGNKSGAALDRLYEVAARINRITETDVEDLAEDFS